MALDLPNNWRPRDYQRPAWEAWEAGCDRELLIWHRRAGKDDVQLHKTCMAAHERVGVYWHALPEYEQARKAIWEAVNPRTQKRRIDEAFPRELRSRTDNGAMTIEFRSGSVWRLVGTDDPNTLVGAPPVGICFSEWALSNPSSWAYLAPILLENKGWASFITTPRGRNHAHKMLELARRNPWSLTNQSGWFSQVLTVADTGFPLALVERQRQEYHDIFGQDAGDALIDQEFWCSFDAAVLGSYYGKLIAEAEREGRITEIKAHPDLPVHTVWDIGKGANMAVWLFQVHYNKVIVLHSISGAHDEMIPDLIERISKFDYRWGYDYLPHDAKVKEHGTRRTRVELMIDLKRKPALVPNHTIDDGINAGRLTLPRAIFDRDGTAEGLEALRQYQAEWDDDKKVFKNVPLHNWTSHYGDAWRYLAMAWREIKADPPPKPPGRTIHEMSLNEAWEMLVEHPRESRI